MPGGEPTSGGDRPLTAILSFGRIALDGELDAVDKKLEGPAFVILVVDTTSYASFNDAHG